MARIHNKLILAFTASLCAGTGADQASTVSATVSTAARRPRRVVVCFMVDAPLSVRGTRPWGCLLIVPVQAFPGRTILQSPCHELRRTARAFSG